jgi:hypothetical protein
MVAAGGGAWAADPFTVDLALRAITAAQAPRVMQDTLVLAVKPARSPRSVLARFAHESWAVVHPLARNEHGVFVLDWEIPEGLREIRYRLWIDGQAMTDPSNPDVQVDAAGIAASVVTLHGDIPRALVTPRREGDGSLTFVYRGTPARRVALVGDFNAWDPFADALVEREPGTYALTVRLPPGRHWYYFFVEGRRTIDVHNPEGGRDPDGVPVSTFVVP